MATGGFTTKIKVLQESTYDDGGVSGEVVFGVTQRFQWTVDTSTTQSRGLESTGPQATSHNDGVARITGTHVWEFTDGRELHAIMGTKTDASEGTFSLDVADTLPSYAVKAVDESENSKNILISGIKYVDFSIEASRDNTIIITANWVGRKIADTGAFTPTESTVEPLSFTSCYLKLDGTDQTDLDSVTLSINRNVVGRRFLENTTTGEKRLISKPVEGVLAVSLEGQIGSKRSILEEVFGGTSFTDSRTDTNGNVVIDCGDTGINLSLSSLRFTNLDRDGTKDEEVALTSFTANALDIDATGTYPTS